MSNELTLQDEAARAGWLYYVAGMTQDQIAAELGVSRQRAQRLVARALAEGLIQIRLVHRIGACLELERALTERYHLTRCRVAPGLGPGGDPARAIATAAAAELERVLRMETPQVIAFGTGRALRAMAEQLTHTDPGRHRIVSLLGNIAPDGSATLYDVISRIAEKLNATYYPMPVPVISDTPEEREFFMHLRPVRTVFNLARQADITFVGVGQMGPDAPLALDGFVTPDVLRELQELGAAGEICSWVYDAQGRYIDTPRNALVGGVRVEPGQSKPVIAVAAGSAKVTAIRAALTGRIVNGLVTDEPTATALLASS
ncbi:sugar-binding transcriptional regulator [Tabrizicola sp. YIM 78059]|uniref:sugar-binding transcriptional regulator n=1 Tax=Tabrizicola sp. YIM 78059 TaxID=2529861 RepID=UPI0010AB021E|nr:sugar-binding transcriptional regulator [Tabrizicola sp. YIM 78059]